MNSTNKTVKAIQKIWNELAETLWPGPQGDEDREDCIEVLMDELANRQSNPVIRDFYNDGSDGQAEVLAQIKFY